MKFANFADARPGFRKTAALRDPERKAIGGVIGGRISRKADFVPACIDRGNCAITDAPFGAAAMNRLFCLTPRGSERMQMPEAAG